MFEITIVELLEPIEGLGGVTESVLHCRVPFQGQLGARFFVPCRHSPKGEPRPRAAPASQGARCHKPYSALASEGEKNRCMHRAYGALPSFGPVGPAAKPES